MENFAAAEHQKDGSSAARLAVVAAVRGGGITMEEACHYYQLSEEEFLSWETPRFERHGLAGLRTNARAAISRTSTAPEVAHALQASCPVAAPARNYALRRRNFGPHRTEEPRLVQGHRKRGRPAG